MKRYLVMFLVLTGLTSVHAIPSADDSDPVDALEAPGGSILISDWINIHLKTIRNGKVLDHHARQSAYTGVALYESIVAGDKNYRSLSGQLLDFNPSEVIGASNEICWESSANSALSAMFKFFYPHDPADLLRFDSLENAWKQHLLGSGYSEASVDAGSKYGELISKQVIEWCKTDNADKSNAPYTVPAGMGLWEPTPPKFLPPVLPFLGNCRTFVKGSIQNTSPPPPMTFSSESESEFFKMANEVYIISGKMEPEMRAIGLFWDDFPDGKSVTAGGHWASILKTVMENQNVSLIEGAHLYAALFITMNDAAIGCFKCKYTFNLIRPVTYIQKYMNHPDWNPLINTPPHPEYPAAHAVISMAAATILTRIMGDTVSFTDNTYAYRGYKPHHFKNFVEAGREAGMSRFYGGIHYLPSIKAGFIQGEKIADNVNNALRFKN